MYKRQAPTQRLQGSQEKDAVRKLEETVKDAEVKAIQSALEAASGNKRRASEILGISIRSLYYKINRYNIIC